MFSCDEVRWLADTVRKHVENILRKLDAETRTAAVNAVRGWIG